LERATSFFFYEKGSDFRLILHRLKYGGQKEIGAIMGRYMAAELLSSHLRSIET
jgi:predicted amidophosphoribosyltransferase